MVPLKQLREEFDQMKPQMASRQSSPGGGRQLAEQVQRGGRVHVLSERAIHRAEHQLQQVARRDEPVAGSIKERAREWELHTEEHRRNMSQVKKS